MKKRVVVTGLGVICPTAKNIPSFAEALKNGKQGISKVEAIDASLLRVNIAGEIKGFQNSPDIDRVTGLALVSAEEAWNMSGISAEEQLGVIWGTSGGGALSFEKYIKTGEKDESLKSRLSAHTTAELIAKKYKAKGKVLTISTACASSANAIGYAFDQIRYGLASIMIAGGSDTINISTYAGFHALRSLDPECCRPFDRERQGLVVGEGAGALILESLDRAVERGAKIYAEIVGCGFSADAYHETSPDPQGRGAALAIKRAIDDAGIKENGIDYIKAHGTGTPLNDKMETLAIKTVFGKRAYQIPVSSTKSMIGHLMGACGVVEGIAVVLAINHSFIPPTVNYKTPDPDCDLDYVPNRSRNIKINVALLNSFAFGGNNVSLVFKKHE